MSYKKILEALRAYEPKELIKLYYECDSKYCAVAAVIPFTRTKHDPINILYNYHEEVRQAARYLECTRDELTRLQQMNDALCNQFHTPEERYASVLTWLEDEVVKEEGQ